LIYILAIILVKLSKFDSTHYFRITNYISIFISILLVMRNRKSRVKLFRDKHQHFLISILADNMDSFKDYSEKYHRVIQFDFSVFGIPHFTTIFINHDLTLVLRIERFHNVIHLVENLDNIDTLVSDFKQWMQIQVLN
jgi:hypothetical protein